MSVIGSASDNTNCSFLQYNQSPQSSLIIGSPNYITINQVRVYEGIVWLRKTLLVYREDAQELMTSSICSLMARSEEITMPRIRREITRSAPLINGYVGISDLRTALLKTISSRVDRTQCDYKCRM